MSFESSETLQIISVKLLQEKEWPKNPPLVWIIKFLLVILGVVSVGIPGDKGLTLLKCYPMPAIALIKQHSLALSVLLSRQSDCPKAGHDGFQCLVQKTSALAFLFNIANKNTRDQAGFPQITAFKQS